MKPKGLGDTYYLGVNPDGTFAAGYGRHSLPKLYGSQGTAANAVSVKKNPGSGTMAVKLIPVDWLDYDELGNIKRVKETITTERVIEIEKPLDTEAEQLAVQKIESLEERHPSDRCQIVENIIVDFLTKIGYSDLANAFYDVDTYAEYS